MRTIKAIYQNGAIKPLERLDLPFRVSAHGGLQGRPILRNALGRFRGSRGGAAGDPKEGIDGRVIGDEVPQGAGRFR